MRTTKMFLTASLMFAGSLGVAHARVDPRAFLSGTWSGNVRTTQPACAASTAVNTSAQRTFVIQRRHGGLTLREPGTDARCRLILSDDGLMSVPGRCRVNGLDVTLLLQPASEGENYTFSATSDGAACSTTISGQVTRR